MQFRSYELILSKNTICTINIKYKTITFVFFIELHEIEINIKINEVFLLFTMS